MCGILTYFNIYGDPVPETLKYGLSALRHRGPDSEGIFRNEGVFLGHQRLKIIDLSDIANQPMSCENERYWIVFNGEIYNFQELRHSLETKGHKFKTHGDTEVLLRLYQELEEGCLKYLNGMFAFVIYDHHKKRMFAARDRLGIKPLYYFWDGTVLAMASELRALLVAKIIDRKVDLTAMRQYLVFGAVQSPYTIIKSVKSLMPGHFLSLKNGCLSIKEYWRPPFIPENDKLPETIENASERVRELLEDSVRLRMISDVPLGAFLSGGIDSSVIVAIMSKLNSSEVKTFSIGFDVGGASYNETDYARQIAARYETDHNEFILTGNDIVRELPKFIHSLDQPSNDGFNSYIISKFTREYVTVSLSGLGGDELFAGYTKTKFFHSISAYRNLLPDMPDLYASTLNNMFQQLPLHLRRSKIIRGVLALLGVWAKPYDFYRMFRTFHTQTELNQLLINQDSKEISDRGNKINYIENLSPLDAACFLDMSKYMGNTLLRDIDVVSMAHNLEVRVPFLDHRLLEYVVQLPVRLKIKRGRNKYLLTNAAKDLLPKEVIERKKMGFSFPFGIWLKNSPLREVMLDCFSKNGLKGREIFNSHELDQLLKYGLKENSSKRPSFPHYKLWMLTILELWMRETKAQLN